MYWRIAPHYCEVGHTDVECGVLQVGVVPSRFLVVILGRGWKFV